MSATGDSDSILRAWLDLMPDEAPDRAIDAVLQAVEVTPQRRSRRWPLRRNSNMNRLVAALGASAIVIAVGSVLLLRGPSAPGVSHSPAPPQTASPSAPSPTPSSSIAAGPVPPELVGRWMGSHRDFADAGAGTSILFDSSSYAVSQSNNNDSPHVTGPATSGGTGTVDLSGADAFNCAPSSASYRYRLSSSGRVLVLSPIGDDCEQRSATVSGTYWLMACRDSGTNCLGNLDAGTYSSQYIRPLLDEGATWAPAFGGVNYTVPDAWANWSDWPGVLGLTTSADFAKTTMSDVVPPTQLTVSTHALPLVAQGCSTDPVASVPSSLDAAFADLGKIKHLTVGTKRSITIGGNEAAYVDLTFDPASAPAECGGRTAFLTGGGDTLSIGAGERQRLYLVDVGHAGFVAIWLTAPNATSFAAVLDRASTIVESMQFK